MTAVHQKGCWQAPRECIAVTRSISRVTACICFMHAELCSPSWDAVLPGLGCRALPKYSNLQCNIQTSAVHEVSCCLCMQVYYVYGFMLLVFLILAIVTVCVTIVGTYFLLNAENYHWQWTSFCAAASTALCARCC